MRIENKHAVNECDNISSISHFPLCVLLKSYYMMKVNSKILRAIHRSNLSACLNILIHTEALNPPASAKESLLKHFKLKMGETVAFTKVVI